MTQPVEFPLQTDKLVEAVIYLCERSADDPHFGVIKLVKLLYYADTEAFSRYGVPITGNTYLHLPHGPYPKNWYLVRQRMEQAGDVRVLYENAGGGHRQYRLIPNRAVTDEVLTSQDRSILDEQLERFAAYNAAGIEEHSHYGFGWMSTEDGEPIPYETAGITAPPYSANEIRIGKQVADEFATRLHAVRRSRD